MALIINRFRGTAALSNKLMSHSSHSSSFSHPNFSKNHGLLNTIRRQSTKSNSSDESVQNEMVSTLKSIRRSVVGYKIAKVIVVSGGIYWAYTYFQDSLHLNNNGFLNDNKIRKDDDSSVLISSSLETFQYLSSSTATFADICGCHEVLKELKNVVEFLKHPKKFQDIGAHFPKGILLVGPPGVGKTLIAKAIAGEAKVPFFFINGSEIDTMYVGSGAKRIKELFQTARILAPCVIFIDEIDSVGRRRTASEMHPYANQTLNQLLSELDGFKESSGITVIAATNRRSQLDEALTRSGRFDMEIHVNIPNQEERAECFRHYLSKIKSHSDVIPEDLAKGTNGLTGADIKNMVNWAAINACLENRSSVNREHLWQAFDKILVGPAKKPIMDIETRKKVAFHEAGHTLVALLTKNGPPVHKVSIIPRGDSLGHTLTMLEDKEYQLVNKAQLLATIDSLMGGKAAEELIFGKEYVTTGVASDIKEATIIAKRMVCSFGMSEKIGPQNVCCLKENLTADAETQEILKESYNRAITLLTEHKAELILLSDLLIEKNTLNGEEIQIFLKNYLDKSFF